jgi:hypothetical protein
VALRAGTASPEKEGICNLLKSLGSKKKPTSGSLLGGNGDLLSSGVVAAVSSPVLILGAIKSPTGSDVFDAGCRRQD